MRRLANLALTEFADIVLSTSVGSAKLRLHFTDGSYADIWFSRRRLGVYAYHWERRHVDGTIFRHDNIPHRRWERVVTFPKHFHNGTEAQVTDSDLPDEPEQALRVFLTFCREKLTG